MKRPLLPVGVAGIGMLPAPAIYMFVGMLSRGQGAHEPASWVFVAMYLTAAYSAFAIWWGIVRLPRHLRKQSSDLLARETDPVALFGICGLALFHFPSGVVFFLSLFAGLPLGYLFAAAAFTVLGTLWWLTAYRQRAEAAGIPSAPG